MIASGDFAISGLVRVREELGGNWYWDRRTGIRGWLCNRQSACRSPDRRDESLIARGARRHPPKYLQSCAKSASKVKVKTLQETYAKGAKPGDGRPFASLAYG